MEIKKHPATRLPVNAIDHKNLAFNADNKKEFLCHLKAGENQVQGLLLWGSIFVMVSYMAVIISIVKFYTSLDAGHPGYLITMMILIISLFGAFLVLQYRACVYQPPVSNLIIKQLLSFKVHIATRQIKLLTAYLFGYSLIVSAACFLCWYNITYGAQQLLSFTAPISIMAYGAGLFLLLKLNFKRNTYLNCIHSIDESIISQFSKQ